MALGLMKLQCSWSATAGIAVGNTIRSPDYNHDKDFLSRFTYGLVLAREVQLKRGENGCSIFYVEILSHYLVPLV